MKEFYNINRKKISFIIKFSIVFFGIIGFFPSLMIRNLSLIERITLNLSIVIFFTSFFYAIVFFSEFFLYKKRKSIFSNDEINKFLILNNFQTIQTNKENRWRLTQKAKCSIFNDFIVIIDIAENKYNTMKIEFLLEHHIIDKTLIKEIYKTLKIENAELEFESIAFYINYKKLKINELNNKLFEFYNIINKYEFKPKKQDEHSRLTLI